MEANRKMRKGFIKGKLVMSLYRATGQPYDNIKPKAGYAVPFSVNQADHQAAKTNSQPPKLKQLSSTTTTTTTTIVNQEKVNPQPKPNVSFMIPATESKCGKFDNPYGGVVGDEGVDAKASTYISCVQERFRLERINSERTRAAPDLQ